MKRDELVELAKNSPPSLGWSEDPFWKNFGYFYFGIGDGYRFYDEKIQDASDEDLWKIVALSSTHWKSKYAEWHNNDSKKLKEFYNWAWKCEKFISVDDIVGIEKHFILLDRVLDFFKKNFNE